MYIYRRISLLLGLVALAGLVLVSCGRGGGDQGDGSDGGSQEQNYTIQLSHVVAEDTPKGLAAVKFKELVEEKSNGQITVEVFPNSQLYGDEDEMQAIQSGALQMIAPTTSKFSTIAENMQVLDLPFIFDNYDDLSEITARDTPVGQVLFENEKLASKNIKVLGLWPDGFKQFAANKAIRTPDDLRGLKVRVQPAGVLRTTYEAWGAQPTTIAFGELYTALEQGVVVAHENPYSVIFGSKTHQVQDFITESTHGTNVSVAAINQEFFDSLPSDLQDAVVEAADEAAAYSNELALEQNTEGKQQILEAGGTEIIELSPEQRQAFKDVVVPQVWDEYADVIGQDVIEYLKSQPDSAGDELEYSTSQ